MIKYILILILVVPIFYINCQINTPNEDKIIYSMVIDDLAQHLPPPPPPSSKNDLSPMPKEVLDSINRIKLNLAVSDQFEILKQKFDIREFESDYYDISKELLSIRAAHNISKKEIGSLIGHQVVLVGIDEIKEKEELFKKFSQLIYLSKIKFNTKRDKAVVCTGSILPGKLSGSTVLYLLKKEKENWIIEHIKELSIS